MFALQDARHNTQAARVSNCTGSRPFPLTCSGRSLEGGACVRRKALPDCRHTLLPRQKEFSSDTPTRFGFEKVYGTATEILRHGTGQIICSHSQFQFCYRILSLLIIVHRRRILRGSNWNLRCHKCCKIRTVCSR